MHTINFKLQTSDFLETSHGTCTFRPFSVQQTAKFTQKFVTQQSILHYRPGTACFQFQQHRTTNTIGKFTRHIKELLIQGPGLTFSSTDINNSPGLNACLVVHVTTWFSDLYKSVSSQDVHVGKGCIKNQTDKVHGVHHLWNNTFVMFYNSAHIYSSTHHYNAIEERQCQHHNFQWLFLTIGLFPQAHIFAAFTSSRTVHRP